MCLGQVLGRLTPLRHCDKTRHVQSTRKAPVRALGWEGQTLFGVVINGNQMRNKSNSTSLLDQILRLCSLILYTCTLSRVSLSKQCSWLYVHRLNGFQRRFLSWFRCGWMGLSSLFRLRLGKRRAKISKNSGKELQPFMRRRDADSFRQRGFRKIRTLTNRLTLKSRALLGTTESCTL